MCGIAGFSGQWPESEARRLISTMTDRMAHRGPDAGGHWSGAGMTLGHRRLSIIDLSDAANQPLIDHSGRYILVFNGEIYNYRELRQALGGRQVSASEGDTDVVLAAYMTWGPACVERFNGMFALAIWDTEARRLFVARDRLGIKPFYFTRKDGGFQFASEIRSLLAGEWSARKLDEAGLVDYLAYGTVQGPRTMLADIQSLPPGGRGIWEQGSLTTETYWSLPTAAKLGPQNPAQAKARVAELLGEAVARRLVSDVPLGAFLSGGIDSSAIVALMAQASTRPVNTFSVVFEEEAFDESPFSQMMADRYRTRHTPILLKPDDFLRELPDALQAMDSPSGDGINSYVVSKVTRDAGITVALSGLGGDELFAGYPVFRQWLKLHGRKSWWGLSRPVRQIAAGLLPLLIKDHRRDRMQSFMRLPSLQFAQAYPLFRTLQTPSRIQALQTSLPSGYNGVQERLKSWNGELSRLPQLSQVSVGEISTYTEPVLLRDTDQMSMAHALEVRVPFFDHSLVEYVLGLSDAIKFPHSPKELLVDAMGDLLPNEVVHRPKKGFVFPWEQWLRHELKSFGQRHIDALAQRGIFDGGAVVDLWKRFQTGDSSVLWFYVWVLIVLENWLQQNDF